MQAKCLGITKTGKPCQATPIKSEDYCYVHHPGMEADRAKWRTAGGHAKAHAAKARKALNQTDPLTPSEVQALLSTTLLGMLTGDVAANHGLAIASACRAYLNVVEAVDLTGRIAAIEHALALETRP